jgi:hypothetical protein
VRPKRAAFSSIAERRPLPTLLVSACDGCKRANLRLSPRHAVRPRVSCLARCVSAMRAYIEPDGSTSLRTRLGAADGLTTWYVCCDKPTTAALHAALSSAREHRKGCVGCRWVLVSDASSDTLLHASCIPSQPASLYPKPGQLRFAMQAAKRPQRRRHQPRHPCQRVQFFSKPWRAPNREWSHRARRLFTTRGRLRGQ